MKTGKKNQKPRGKKLILDDRSSMRRRRRRSRKNPLIYLEYDRKFPKVGHC